MSLTTWIAASAELWSEPTAWDNGVPGSDDDAVLDASGAGNCTLDGPISVRSLQVLGTYTGTFDDGGYDVTIGDGDCILIADSGAWIATGDWTIGGDDNEIVFYDPPSGNFATNAITLTGTSTYRANLSYGGSDNWYTWLFAAGSNITLTNASYGEYAMDDFPVATFGGSITLRGEITLDSQLRMVARNADVDLDGAEILTGEHSLVIDGANADVDITITSTPTSDDPAHVRISAIYDWADPVTLGAGDYRWCTLVAGDIYDTANQGRLVLGSGAFDLGDILLNVASGSTSEFDGATNSPTIRLHGDIATSSSGGTLDLSGDVQLTGTADQSIDLVAADTVPGVASNKPDGAVDIAGNVTQGGDWLGPTPTFSGGCTWDTGDHVLHWPLEASLPSGVTLQADDAATRVYTDQITLASGASLVAGTGVHIEGERIAADTYDGPQTLTRPNDMRMRRRATAAQGESP